MWSLRKPVQVIQSNKLLYKGRIIQIRRCICSFRILVSVLLVFTTIDRPVYLAKGVTDVIHV